MTKAELTAAVYRLPLLNLVHVLKIFTGRLDTAPVAEPSGMEWIAMLADLQTRTRVPAEDLLKFSILGNGCALNLAHADADLTSCETLIGLIIGGVNAGDQFAARARQIDLLANIAYRALDYLEVALIPIAAAAKVHKAE